MSAKDIIFINIDSLRLLYFEKKTRRMKYEFTYSFKLTVSSPNAARLIPKTKRSQYCSAADSPTLTLLGSIALQTNSCSFGTASFAPKGSLSIDVSFCVDKPSGVVGLSPRLSSTQLKMNKK